MISSDTLKRLRELQSKSLPGRATGEFAAAILEASNDLISAAEQVPALVAALRRARAQISVTSGHNWKCTHARDGQPEQCVCALGVIDAALAAHPEENTAK